MLALLTIVVSMSAIDAPTYSLTKATDAEAHGTITFKVGENAVTSAKEGDVVTVTITPATGWVVNQPSGQWFAAIAAAPQRRSIDLLNGVTLTPVEGQTNQWTFTMQRANVEINTTYKKLLTNADITVADITAPTYTGQALTPTVTVKDGETALVLNTDYTVAYSNNTNAALATATTNAPTVTITAVSTSEKYAGETTKKFTITKKALTVKADNKEVTFGDDAPTYTESYDGFVNNETKAVLSGTLSLTCDYVKNQTGAGNYDITPSGLTSSNYDITFTKGTLTVGKKALEDDFIADIDALTYTGEALTPEPAVTFNGMTLVKGTDFTYSYQNNTNAALATDEKAPTVTITAVSTSEKYAGGNSTTFTILQKTVGLKWGETTFDCDDTDKQPTVTVTGLVEGDECTATVEGKGKAVGSYTAEVTALSNANYQLPKKTSTDFVIVRDMSTVFSGDNAWATYVAKENLATPFGLEAYVVSAVTETAITAKSVSYIPVGVGILLKRSVAGVTSYKGEAYEGTPENMASLLKGSATAATDVTAYKDFVLYRDEFVMSSASSIAAGRACLPAASAPAGASRLDIVIDGNLTGVDTLNVERGTVNDGSFYDLSGRKLAQPTAKGVYIMNGKKVVIK